MYMISLVSYQKSDVKNGNTDLFILNLSLLKDTTHNHNQMGGKQHYNIGRSDLI